MEKDNSGRVMVVDHMHETQTLIAAWLRMLKLLPMEGVLVANNLSIARRNLEQIDDKPSLIIFDPGLQNEEGIAFLEGLKLKESSSRFFGTTVVVFSANDNSVVKAKWMDLGVNGIIQKPTVMSQFADGLKAAIANKRPKNE